MPARLGHPPGPHRTPRSRRPRATGGRLGLALLGCAVATVATAQVGDPAPASIGARDVRVRLIFGGEADLDLFVTDPMHEEIYYGNSPSRLGGRFDRDQRCGDPTPRVESVRFSPAPPGRYRVSVDFPIRCRSGVDEVGYRVIVEANGERRRIDGRARFGNLEPVVVEFDVGEAAVR